MTECVCVCVCVCVSIAFESVCMSAILSWWGGYMCGGSDDVSDGNGDGIVKVMV